MTQIQLGEIVTMAMVAVALGMDSFSVSIGFGMKSVSLRQIGKISLVNGFFHMLMPLIGLLLGRYLSAHMGELAIVVGGLLLILFGLHMIFYSIYGSDKESPRSTTLVGIILFSLGVSIDAFSVGLSFGLFSVHIWVMVLFFGTASTVLTASGLLLGKTFGTWLGKYSEILGGIILLMFGLKILT